MSPLRFGIAATADQIWPIYQDMNMAEGAEVVAVVRDASAEGEALTAMISAPMFSSLAEMLTTAEVDAVYLALSPGAQEKALRQVIGAGKHALLEAPWQAPFDEAVALWKEARSRGIALGIAVPWAVDAAMAAARMFVRAGLLGEILSWHADHMSPQTGDPLWLALPMADLFHWLTGLEATQVCATRSESANGRERVVVLTITYADGCLASLQLGMGVPGKETKKGPVLIGSLGQLDLTDEPQAYRTSSSEDALAYTWQPVRYAGPRGSRTRAITEFAARVAAGQEPPFAAGEALEALRILETARRSLAVGHPCSAPKAC